MSGPLRILNLCCQGGYLGTNFDVCSLFCDRRHGHEQDFIKTILVEGNLFIRLNPLWKLTIVSCILFLGDLWDLSFILPLSLISSSLLCAWLVEIGQNIHIWFSCKCSFWKCLLVFLDILFLIQYEPYSQLKPVLVEVISSM